MLFAVMPVVSADCTELLKGVGGNFIEFLIKLLRPLF